MKADIELELQLKNRKEKGGYRYLKKSDNRMIDFSSNDYLGLAKIKEIHNHSVNFIDNGAAGSRLLSGNKNYHEELEAYLADFFKADSALLFNSGYVANLGVLSSVPQKGDTVLMDELSHVCIKEGVRLGRAKYFNFKHNDIKDLEIKIQKADGNVFIVVESVYSMDGDQAPLRDIVEIAEKYEAAVIVDEAHSTALYGKAGFGLSCDLGLENKIFARIYTFGKAAGAHGAAVCGSRTLKEYLINYSRQFIYTTALPFHSVNTIKNGLKYRRDNPELWEDLKLKIQLFQSQLSQNVTSLDSSHPIQGIISEDAKSTVEFADYLNQSGFDIRPILSPTVPKGKERVRICLHAFNSEEEITNLCQHINQYFQ
ncbi:pyridoxal phosphate-dependent aminotransferase family protein [Marivirga tractuosa]|uniref:aminotransferase class I/II-fold pyridoxal phosphate-dependent enzyme n=1 Tax=Marivirga tractuosa TaxID=1006 RepID=UPI0035CF812B